MELNSKNWTFSKLYFRVQSPYIKNVTFVTFNRRKMLLEAAGGL
jgi:hypothetical protein